MPGDLNVQWIHGSPDCAQTTDPPIQVHRYDADTFILRQSKCSEPGTIGSPGPSFEAPFLYLLFGQTRALLLDTGASISPAVFPIAATVDYLLQAHAAAQGNPPVPLLIAHSHSHGDHTAGDGQFQARPDTVLVSPNLPAVKAFFQLPNWPQGHGVVDLGGRIVDVLPIPGHEQAHIALYDRQTQLLLTGDTLYPGLLVVDDWAAYVQSVGRLKAFADAHPASFALGAHIEMTDQPGRWFALGTLFQPGEHVLQLQSQHLTELHEALQAIGAQPRVDRHADFIVYPAGHPFPSLDP